MVNSYGTCLCKRSWEELESSAKEAMALEAAREVAAREEILEELALRREGETSTRKIGEKVVLV